MASGRRKMIGSEYFGRSARGTMVDTRTHFQPKLPREWWRRVLGPGASNHYEQKESGKR